MNLSHGASSSFFYFIFGFEDEIIYFSLLIFLAYEYKVLFSSFYYSYLDYENEVLYTT